MPISPYTTAFDEEVQTYKRMRKAYLAAEKEKKKASKQSSSSFSSRIDKFLNRNVDQRKPQPEDDAITLVDDSAISQVVGKC